METSIEKFNGLNFHTWKVKIQMQLTNKKLWGIIKGMEVESIDAKQLIEWQTRDEKAKYIIGLSLSYSKLHQVDMENSSKEI